MLVVSPIEKAQLLLPMRRIVSGVHVEQDLTSASYLFTAHANEGIEQNLLTADDLAR